MSTNENQDVDLQNNEQDLDTTEEETEDSDKQDKSKEKPKFTDEQQLAIHKREAKKLEKKLGVNSEEKPPKVEEKAKSDELDFGQLAFHNSKSDAIKIEAEEDIDFLKETIKETGKSQQSILASKWFVSELKDRQENRKSSEAVPKGNKRSTSSAKDDLTVALAKHKQTGELPTDFDLRGKVVDNLLKEEGSNSQFYNSK